MSKTHLYLRLSNVGVIRFIPGPASNSSPFWSRIDKNLTMYHHNQVSCRFTRAQLVSSTMVQLKWLWSSTLNILSISGKNHYFVKCYQWNYGTVSLTSSNVEHLFMQFTIQWFKCSSLSVSYNLHHSTECILMQTSFLYIWTYFECLTTLSSKKLASQLLSITIE